jgi:hypothetical protein
MEASKIAYAATAFSYTRKMFVAFVPGQEQSLSWCRKNRRPPMDRR